MRAGLVTGSRRGILDKAQLSAKRARLDPQAFLDRLRGARGVGKLVPALDGGGRGHPDAQQQDKIRGVKPHLSQSSPDP